MERVTFLVFGTREPGLDRMVLTTRERTTLRKAAAILAALREARGDLDDDETTDMALAAYICSDLAAEGSVPVEDA